MKEYIGKRYGQLTVIEKTDKTKYARKYRIYLCECDCGKRKEYSTIELMGDVRSCGCIRQQNLDGFGKKNKGKTPPGALPLGEACKNALYGRYRYSAKKRGHDFNLDEQTFRRLISLPCHYCGMPPSQTLHDRHREEGSLTYSGIDRRNNDQGYEPENCVPCCGVCNRAKDTMNEDDFLRWVKVVFNRSVAGSDTRDVSSS